MRQGKKNKVNVIYLNKCKNGPIHQIDSKRAHCIPSYHLIQLPLNLSDISDLVQHISKKICKNVWPKKSAKKKILKSAKSKDTIVSLAKSFFLPLSTTTSTYLWQGYYYLEKIHLMRRHLFAVSTF